MGMREIGVAHGPLRCEITQKLQTPKRENQAIGTCSTRYED
jgi:hypothetical protein